MIDPSSEIITEESDHLFLSYCTFVNNIKGKKLSIQNVFIETLSNDKFKQRLKEILNLETDYEIVRVFLEFDNSIAKSKVVSTYLKSLQKEKK